MKNTELPSGESIEDSSASEILAKNIRKSISDPIGEPYFSLAEYYLSIGDWKNYANVLIDSQNMLSRYRFNSDDEGNPIPGRDEFNSSDELVFYSKT